MSSSLRIAQVAPLFESVPPKLYGGTERVVSYLADGLVQAGHQVTLFASGDSMTSASLRGIGQRALRLDSQTREPAAAHAYMLDMVKELQEEFDVVHFHCEFSHLPLLDSMRVPCVTTLHGRLDQEDAVRLYQRYPNASFVSISSSQRRPLPANNWEATVYHGLPKDLYRPNYEEGEYFAFLGRLSAEKGVERAVEIAQWAGIPLKIAAKLDETDRKYFEERVASLLKLPFVEYIGEIGEAQKEKFLGEAKALLFPIDWPEPFGMVMIEAMACATPVLAFRRGSVPEVLEDGVSGVVVDSVGPAIARLDELLRMDRRRVRKAFEHRFSLSRMTAGYLAVYERLLAGNRERKKTSGARWLEWQ